MASNDATLFKRVLDMGAQSVMVPYVQTADEAAAAVHAMRYGPLGMRGMAGMTRATRYGKIDDYFDVAEDELCLIVQVETLTGLQNLDAIAGTDRRRCSLHRPRRPQREHGSARANGPS